MSASEKWRFYIDRGGTFTDVVAEAPDGTLNSLKLLSEHPAYDDAALEGIRRCLGVASGAALPAEHRPPPSSEEGRRFESVNDSSYDPEG